VPNIIAITSPGDPNTIEQAFPLIDPLRVRLNRQRFRRNEVPELAFANSFYSMGGRWPSKGWVLVRRGDYNQIPPYGSVLLEFDDGVTTVTLPQLYIVQARCVTRGLAADPEAIYLVELTDAQGVLYAPWFQMPTTSQYNVAAVAYPGNYFQNSMNAGIPFTWDGMVKDLWNQMAQFLGPYPGLPMVPTGPPENFIFPGVSAWEALNEILDFLGLTIGQDLQMVNGYSIVISGNLDPAFQALQAANQNRLQDDREWIDAGAGRLPGQIVCLFHRQNLYYGTEETVRQDSLQWSTTPFYTVTIPAPAAFSAAPGTGYLWCDFQVRYDVDGNPLAIDVAAANAIANQRATQFYNTIHRGTLGYMYQTYAGLIRFVTGSQVDGVRWYHNYETGRSGWKTDIVRGYAWPETEFTLSARGILGI
jgi:hypothetical protein